MTEAAHTWLGAGVCIAVVLVVAQRAYGFWRRSRVFAFVAYLVQQARLDAEHGGEDMRAARAKLNQARAAE